MNLVSTWCQYFPTLKVTCASKRMSTFHIHVLRDSYQKRWLVYAPRFIFSAVALLKLTEPKSKLSDKLTINHRLFAGNKQYWCQNFRRYFLEEKGSKAQGFFFQFTQTQKWFCRHKTVVSDKQKAPQTAWLLVDSFAVRGESCFPCSSPTVDRFPRKPWSLLNMPEVLPGVAWKADSCCPCMGMLGAWVVAMG